jgi:membrane fusion protein PltH
VSKPPKTTVMMILALAGITAAGATWWLTGRGGRERDLVLYGNMDLRQVELAFNHSERIAAVLVQEGDRVQRGQVLARLDGSRLEPEVAEAEARAAAQHQAVERLHNGSRPEELNIRTFLRSLALNKCKRPGRPEAR